MNPTLEEIPQPLEETAVATAAREKGVKVLGDSQAFATEAARNFQ